MNGGPIDLLELLKDYHVPGTPPGTLRPAEGETGPARIRVASYSSEEIEKLEVSDPEALRTLPQDDRRTHWVHVIGLGDVEGLRKLGEVFALHPLALEDVVHLGQRPKAEHYEKVLFIVLQHVSYEGGALVKRQVSIFLGAGFVVSFQPSGPDLLEPIRDRLERGRSRMRERGGGYLAYSIVDLVVDSAFPCLEAVGERLEEIEDAILERPGREAVRDLQRTRRELLKLRQVLWPQRELMSRLAREDSAVLGEENRVYLRDCYDHAVQALEVSENYREMASGLLDIYLSNLSHRLNEIMRVLTIISTIFIPLGFLAGVYGMNFDRSNPWNMPELGLRYGYLGFWAVVLLLAFGMVLVFRRRGWL